MTKTAKSLPFAIILMAFLPYGTRANTYTAASCSFSDVQSQVSSANDGDTVLVSGGGNATWSTPLMVSKGITLNGQGCVITLAGGSSTLVSLLMRPRISSSLGLPSTVPVEVGSFMF
jgi:hypothetical protein